MCFWNSRANQERYRFLNGDRRLFDNFRVVPPGTGIVHQVNLEYLARVVWTSPGDGAAMAYPDTVVGTDSHTTMINGLGILGWGVGGIEAEAAMLGPTHYHAHPPRWWVSGWTANCPPDARRQIWF